jgi:hypothetical protein
MCARCSSLDRKATWHVLHVKGWVDCTDAMLLSVCNMGRRGGEQRCVWWWYSDAFDDKIASGVGLGRQNYLEGRGCSISGLAVRGELSNLP